MRDVREEGETHGKAPLSHAGNLNIPQMNWGRVGLFVPQGQCIKVRDTGNCALFERLLEKYGIRRMKATRRKIAAWLKDP